MDFPEIKTLAQNLTDLLKVGGLSLFGVAIGVGLIMIMFAWGDERKEGTAKRGITTALIGAGGLLIMGTIKIVLARVFGVAVW